MALHTTISKGYLKVARQCVLVLATLLIAGTSAFPQATDPANEVARLFLAAKTAQEEGKYDDAILAYRQVVALSKDSPKNSALAYFNAGIIYLRFQKYAEAANAFQQSILLDPNSAESHNNLGESLAFQKKFPQAIAAFQRANQLDKNLLIAQFNMGLTYTRMGQLKYAEFVFKVLVRDHPDYALGYDGMAVTLSKSGRTSEAIPLHERPSV
ncbi:MAG: tetratricopeptide repeat protein [Pyrinomonadaceae bacterium]